jgi:hypothetical protein
VFPFSLKQIGMAKDQTGFRITRGKETTREVRQAPEQEWMMPNLSNLPLRTAVEKVAVYSAHIKVYGSGKVASQSPRPFERLKGETDCVIQGSIATE